MSHRSVENRIAEIAVRDYPNELLAAAASYIRTLDACDWDAEVLRITRLIRSSLANEISESKTIARSTFNG